jgi:hypothetical protein
MSIFLTLKTGMAGMMKYQQGVQNGFPARPQRAQRRRVLFQYVEPLTEARTKPGKGASWRARAGRVRKEAVFNTLPSRSRLRCLCE